MKSVQNIISDMIKDFVENGACENCVTSMTVSPSVFHRLEIESGYNGFGSGSNSATFHSQVGTITIKKDIEFIIKEKQDIVDRLLREIEDIKNES